MKPLRKCKKCGIEAHSQNELDLFPFNKDCSHQRRNTCKKCVAKTSREYHYKTKYDITVEEYETLHREQEGKCKICNSKDPKRPSGVFVVDHCHINGHVRGLLCDDCNLALGKFKDNIKALESAINYLKDN